MKSPVWEEEGPTPAKLCALYDLGGGVRLADSFAVYSVVAFPPEWATIKIELGVSSQLEKAASRVATKIPILFDLRDPPLANLVSLPCPTHEISQSNSRINPRDHLPWFLINAARYQRHCVLGRSDTLTTILVVLQRPWCILELCCCDTSTIAALHEFAIAALKLDESTYGAALRLLAHELSCRKHNGPEIPGGCQFAGATQKCTRAHDAFITYKELASSCLRSHNSFWIGLISTCAVYFGLAFSDLTKMLDDLVSSSGTMGAETSSALKARCRTFSAHSASLLSRSQAKFFVSSRHPQKLVPLRRHSIDVISHTEEDPQVTTRSSLSSRTDPQPKGAHVRNLLCLYARILEKFREDIL